MLTWIKNQIDWVKSFFSESDGKGSNKRLLSSAVVAAFLVPYVKVSIVSQNLTDIPTTWAIMIAAIIGLNIADYLVKGYISKTINGKEENVNG